ncbi:carbohydrate kinase [Neobittarella massiliensis]|uniref:carbohydrate kinase n=1 Tax=Neobittarella massiliensis (ex Bilen et al. 2018) TaxID=2041842 RepID=UPI000CF5ECCD|nr:carbohydrate kinase [Neobittarella massiliensis]
MTKREFEILNYLKAHPMATQDEIAQAFCVARSTISAHISNLQSKGYIAGRGYIFNRDYVVCAGTSNVDVSAFASAPLAMHNKNPNAVVKMSAGGVARNICENLSRQGINTKMLTNVGSDGNGRFLIKASRQAGIDMDHVQVVKGAASCTYISLHQPNGDLALGVTDMHLSQLLTRAYFQSKRPVIEGARFLVLSPCLPKESLDYLLHIEGVPCFVDVVSSEYVPKVQPLLGRLHTLKANEFEIQALTGIELRGEKDLEKSARWVLEHGVQQVFITLGERGAYAQNQKGQKVRMPAPSVAHIASTDGAGDAFSAAIIYGALNQFSLTHTVAYAQSAAALTLQCDSAINPALCAKKILEFQGGQS